MCLARWNQEHVARRNIEEPALLMHHVSFKHIKKGRVIVDDERRRFIAGFASESLDPDWPRMGSRIAHLLPDHLGTIAGPQASGGSGRCFHTVLSPGARLGCPWTYNDCDQR